MPIEVEERILWRKNRTKNMRLLSEPLEVLPDTWAHQGNEFQINAAL